VAERGRDVRLRHRLAHLDVLWTTTMQREIPEESISRVSAYDIFGSLAFAPLGLLLSGPIAAAIGPGLHSWDAPDSSPQRPSQP
jgi:hypothetical protein